MRAMFRSITEAKFIYNGIKNEMKTKTSKKREKDKIQQSVIMKYDAQYYSENQQKNAKELIMQPLYQNIKAMEK